jgi:uncharacterized membrane protein YidH (DUF202 family)
MSADTFGSIVGKATILLDRISILIIGLAVVYFLSGLVGYIMHSGNEQKRKDSVQHMIWGIVGLFLMVSFWSFVYIVANFIGADAGMPLITY